MPSARSSALIQVHGNFREIRKIKITLNQSQKIAQWVKAIIFYRRHGRTWRESCRCHVRNHNQKTIAIAKYGFFLYRLIQEYEIPLNLWELVVQCMPANVPLFFRKNPLVSKYLYKKLCVNKCFFAVTFFIISLAYHKYPK